MDSNKRVTLFTYPPAGIVISTDDYKLLAEWRFLNDTLIEFYLQYIYNTIFTPKQREKIYTFSTFFYQKLTSRDSDIDFDPTPLRQHSLVKRWTKNVNIFEKDFIIVPICKDVHWFLAIICYPSLAEDDSMMVDRTVETGEHSQPMDLEPIIDAPDSCESHQIKFEMPNLLMTSEMYDIEYKVRNICESYEFEDDAPGTTGSCEAEVHLASTSGIYDIEDDVPNICGSYDIENDAPSTTGSCEAEDHLASTNGIYDIEDDVPNICGSYDIENDAPSTTGSGEAEVHLASTSDIYNIEYDVPYIGGSYDVIDDARGTTESCEAGVHLASTSDVYNIEYDVLNIGGSYDIIDDARGTTESCEVEVHLASTSAIYDIVDGVPNIGESYDIIDDARGTTESCEAEVHLASTSAIYDIVDGVPNICGSYDIENDAPSTTGSCEAEVHLASTSAIYNIEDDVLSSESRVKTELKNKSATKKEESEEREPVKEACIFIFDSLRDASETNVAKVLRNYLSCEYEAKMSVPKVFDEFNCRAIYPAVDKQSNNSDCGLYVLQYVEQFFKEPIMDYTLPEYDLLNWFDNSVIKNKRQHIARVIESIMLKTNPFANSITLPTL